MRPVGNHLQAAILRAIAAIIGANPADREKPILIVETMQSTDWASATFIGALHCIEFRIEGEAGLVAQATQRLAIRIEDCDIPIAGHIVAEIKMETPPTPNMTGNIIAQSLTVNALTIAD